MKGTHLAFDDDGDSGDTIAGGGGGGETTTGTRGEGRRRRRRRRAWLTLGNLLNVPPRPDGHPDRDISLATTAAMTRRCDDPASDRGTSSPTASSITSSS